MTRHSGADQVRVTRRNRCGAVLLAVALVVSACSVTAPAAQSPQTASLSPDEGQIAPSSSGSPDRNPASQRGGPYPVTRVVDGDTVDVLVDGRRTRIRVIGINTPETVAPSRPVQCFGPQASAKAKELLSGRSVWLESDPSQGSDDSYGRRLAFVWINNDVDFGLSMIRGGYAAEYTYKLPYRYRATYRAAQAKARSDGLGLWSSQTCGGDFRRGA